MRTNSQLNFLYICRSVSSFSTLIAVGILLVTACSNAFAETASTNLSQATPKPSTLTWDQLSTKTDLEAKSASTEGYSLIISGGITFVGSVVGYFASTDIFLRAVFSVGQNLGTLATGYGASRLLTLDELRFFREVVSNSGTLRPEDRDSLAESYDQLGRLEKSKERKVKMVTHGITAALNFVNATTFQTQELKAAFIFLGALNTLAFFNYTFSKDTTLNAFVLPTSNQMALTVSF